ncbi:MAG: nucleoside deaminase [Candidatus Cyclobacteriaceae bacterium M3_2C_046]
MEQKEKFMLEAIRLSLENVQSGKGGPFGALIVKDDQIIGAGVNLVTANNDPTQHAEINAIRQACQHLNSFRLSGCQIYTSCEPCPMCLGAIYWARLDKIYYANNRNDAAEIGFDDQLIYRELASPLPERSLPMERIFSQKALAAFSAWKKSGLKSHY